MVIYQLFMRLFGNECSTNRPNGTLEENGCGKFNFITNKALQSIKNWELHIFGTGVINHASQTAYPTCGITAIMAPYKGKSPPYAIRDY